MLNQKENKKMVDLFLTLVSINSSSGKEQRIARYLKNYLKDLGIKSSFDSYGNLLAKIPGKGEPLMLCAHLDTVPVEEDVKPVVKNGFIMSSGQTILGADDKAGITEIIIAIEWIIKNKQVSRPLELVFTKEEEIGALGAKNLEYDKILSKEGLVFDRGGNPAVAVIASPYVIDIDIEIEGRAAHSGYPENGINALSVAVKSLSKLKLGRVDKETTANFLIKKGGEIKNGVPADIVLKGEVRSHRLRKAESYLEKLQDIFNAESKKVGAKITLKTTFVCHGYLHSTKEPIIKKIEKTWTKMGEKFVYEKAGSVSDANEFARAGIKAITVGYGGIMPHSKEEKIKISDMEKTTNFLINFLISL